jgi:hypothetical protein
MEDSMKRNLLRGALVALSLALVGIFSTGMAAAPDARLWSIAVHLGYADGTALEYVFAEGVPTHDVSSYLRDCGRSHRNGTVVRYHCYPIPE